MAEMAMKRLVERRCGRSARAPGPGTGAASSTGDSVTFVLVITMPLMSGSCSRFTAVTEMMSQG